MFQNENLLLYFSWECCQSWHIFLKKVKKLFLVEKDFNKKDLNSSQDHMCEGD